MPLKIKCASCGQVLEAPDDLAGKKAKCHNCGAVVELRHLESAVGAEQSAVASPQPTSPFPEQAPGTAIGSAPLGPLLQDHVESDDPASTNTADGNPQGKNVFATAVGITVGCAVAGAIFWVGVCVLIAIFFARPAKVVDSTVEESTPSAAEMILGTQIPSEQGFEFKNVTTRRDISILKVVGEVTNKSGRSYAEAHFAITLYDKGGKLLDTAQGNVSNLADGATRGFEIPLVSVWGDEIGRYKIEFKGGM